MTGRDIFPFGKYGRNGESLTLQQVKDEHMDYIDWLRDQPWAEEKWAKLLDWFDCGDSVTSSIKERAVINVEVELLKDAPIGFLPWWRGAYGERLRKDGEQLYIAHLRVALEAWGAALRRKDFPELPANIPAPNIVKPPAPPIPTPVPKPVTPSPTDEPPPEF